MSEFLRYYPGYTMDSALDELSLARINMFVEEASKRPYEYVVMIDPKKL